MNKLASSFSLSAYDFLAVLIPGGIILSSIIYSPYFKNLIRTSTEKSGDSPEWLRYTLLFILAYLLGLIWKMFMDWIFKFLRNNPDHIKIYYKYFADKVESRAKKKGKNEEEIRRIVNEKVKQKYYLDYYFLQRKNALGQVSVLERQFAFVRNILLLMPFLADLLTKIFLIRDIKIIIGVFVVGFIISFILLFLLQQIQLKVYELISEGTYYYKKFAKLSIQKMKMPEDSVDFLSSEVILLIIILFMQYILAFLYNLKSGFFIALILLPVAVIPVRSCLRLKEVVDLSLAKLTKVITDCSNKVANWMKSICRSKNGKQLQQDSIEAKKNQSPDNDTQSTLSE